MKTFGKKLMTAGMALLLAAAFSNAVFAYDSDHDKAIRSVALTVRGYFELDSNMGQEGEIEVSTSGNKYDYDHYEIMNEGFKWT